MLDIITNDYQIKNLVIVYSISAVIFFSVFFIRQLFDTDFEYFNKSFQGCNLWCFKHIILYTILSYLSPKYWWFLLGFGLFFEFIELYLSKFTKYINSNISTDLIFNSIGILLGLLLHKIYPIKIDLHKLFQEYIVFYKNKNKKFNK